MRSFNTQKIDLNTEYPCPCRHRGHLQPITLTEAFGCDRCQQIFVVENNYQVLEQLSTTYPYKRSWRWTGYRWKMIHPRVRDNYLPLILCMAVVILIVWLPLALKLPPGSSIISWAIFAILLAILPAFIMWLAYRR